MANKFCPMARHGKAERYRDSRDGNKRDASSRLLRPDHVTDALVWTKKTLMSTVSYVNLEATHEVGVAHMLQFARDNDGIMVFLPRW